MIMMEDSADIFDISFAVVSHTFTDAKIFMREQLNDLSLDPLFADARSLKGSGRFRLRDELLWKTNYRAAGACFFNVIKSSM